MEKGVPFNAMGVRNALKKRRNARKLLCAMRRRHRQRRRRPQVLKTPFSVVLMGQEIISDILSDGFARSWVEIKMGYIVKHSLKKWGTVAYAVKKALRFYAYKGYVIRFLSGTTIFYKAIRDLETMKAIDRAWGIPDSTPPNESPMKEDMTGWSFKGRNTSEDFEERAKAGPSKDEITSEDFEERAKAVPSKAENTSEDFEERDEITSEDLEERAKAGPSKDENTSEDFEERAKAGPSKDEITSEDFEERAKAGPSKAENTSEDLEERAKAGPSKAEN
ncbi:uncharacterized protein LOC121854244 [Homarus americanus]|uniref:uncharacterized protein LOC121854244 n=1 Tax=Homarus americanus TaxID=6706 RepID=UPI001C479650|nr:uncharacterized protein LOC121854244 [Homarus americanus]